MKVIPISGIIESWQMENEENVTPHELRKSLDEANGESVRIDINTPGGSVDQGLEMYNLIKNYSGHTETRVVSMAASMGSILALAGDKRTAEKTASYMIHNAWGMAIGDYRKLRNAADDMEHVTAHLSNIYTDKIGIDNLIVRNMMDKETWKYGEELSEFGFEIVDASDEMPISEARITSKARYKNYIDASKNHSEEAQESLSKVAASLVLKKTKMSTNETVKTPVAEAGDNKENSVKNLEELKAQHPDLYAQAVKVGVEEHADLVNAHLTMGTAGNCMDLAVKNIKENKAITNTVNAEYMAEGLKVKDVSDRADDETTNLGSDSDVNAEAENEEYEKALGKGMRGRKK